LLTALPYLTILAQRIIPGSTKQRSQVGFRRRAAPVQLLGGRGGEWLDLLLGHASLAEPTGEPKPGHELGDPIANNPTSLGIARPYAKHLHQVGQGLRCASSEIANHVRHGDARRHAVGHAAAGAKLVPDGVAEAGAVVVGTEHRQPGRHLAAAASSGRVTRLGGRGR